MRLSVIVIARDEEQVIARCLESVRFADELIVLDGGSTDRTVEICERLGARVVNAPDWPGFGPQKNRAAALAAGDWLLSIDADEWVSPELASEVRQVIAAPQGPGCLRVAASVQLLRPLHPAREAGGPTMSCACSGAGRPASATTPCTNA